MTLQDWAHLHASTLRAGDPLPRDHAGGATDAVRWRPRRRSVLSGPTEDPFPVRFVTLPGGRPAILSTGLDEGKTQLWDPIGGGCLYSLEGTTGFNVAAAIGRTEDGLTMLGTCDENGRLRLWDLSSGELIRAFEVDREATTSNVFFTGSDGRLALATAGEAVRLWDPLTGSLLRELVSPAETYFLRAGTLPEGAPVLAGAGLEVGGIHLWDPLSGDTLAELNGHPGGVMDIAFLATPNGLRLFSVGGEDGNCRWWEVPSGQLIREYPGQPTMWSAPMFAHSPDGTLLHATRVEASVEIRDAMDGRLLRTLDGHEDQVIAVALWVRPDGTVLAASGGDDNTVRLWDAEGGHLLRTLTGHTDRVLSVAVETLPTGQVVVASAGEDDTIRLWDATSGDLLVTFGGHDDTVRAVAAGGPLIATGSEDRTVRLWDAATGRCLRTLTEHTDYVRSLAFAEHDGVLVLASAGEDHTVRLWDAHAGTVRHVLSGHQDYVTSVALATLTDGTLIAVSGDEDNLVRTWDVGSGERRHTLAGHTGRVTAVAVLAVEGNPSQIASASEDGTIRLWDAGTGAHLQALRSEQTSEPVGLSALAVATLADGRVVVAAGGDDHATRLWDVTTGELLHTFEGHTDDVLTVAMGTHEGATLLATGSDDETCRLWSVPDGAPIATIELPESVAAVCLSSTADGLTLVVSSDDSTYIYELAEARPPVAPTADRSTGGHAWTLVGEPVITRLSGHTGEVVSVGSRVLPDGSVLLATASYDPSAGLWDALTGQRLHSLVHSERVYSVAVGLTAGGSPVVVSGTEAGRVHLWSVDSGEHLGELSESGVAFAVDLAVDDSGRLLVARSDNDGASIVDARTETALGRMSMPGGSAHSLALRRSARGDWLCAAAAERGSVRLWSSAEGVRDLATLVRDVAAPDSYVFSVALGEQPDGRVQVAAGAGTGEVHVWNGATGEQLWTLPGRDGRDYARVAFASMPDGVLVLVTWRKTTVEVWSYPGGERLCEIPDLPNTYYMSSELAVESLPDGRMMIALPGGEERDVWVVWLQWRVPVARPWASSAEVRWPGGDVSAAVDGVVSLVAAQLPSPPLGALVDIVRATGRAAVDAVAFDGLSAVAGSRGAGLLRALGWGPRARAGIAALVLADVAVPDRFAAPPEASPEELRSALAEALSTHVDAAVDRGVSADAVRRAADAVDDRMVGLLTVLGEVAVAADASLPVRVRGQAALLAPLPAVARRLLASGRHRPRSRPAGAASTAAAMAGIAGVGRRGSPANLLPTQLALPEWLFAARLVSAELLYRLYDGRADPRAVPTTVVVDNSPATFGPMESTLRLVAHGLAMTLSSAGVDVIFVGLDRPHVARVCRGPEDLVAMWTARTLDPPELQAALATAAAQPTARTVLLTQHHLVRDQHIRASRRLRVVTTNAPGDPVRRPPASRWHLHLPARPSAPQILTAISALTGADDGEARTPLR